LDKLQDIKPADERAKQPASNKLTKQAKEESRTKIDPKSVSGAKVVDFIKTGRTPESGASFAPMLMSTEASNAKLTDSTKSSALKSEWF
jgi:hypothetical protein